MEEVILIVTAQADGERLDKFVSDNTELSRSFAAKLAKEGSVYIGGKPADKNYRLRQGDCVTVFVPEPEILEVKPEDIPLDIIYEDEELLVVNKPQGMVVHPAPGNYSGTLVNALLYHCRNSLSAINGVIRPGIVHRIDKDTSGLLVVAKTNEAHVFLAEHIKEHKTDRHYTALLNGIIKQSGEVNKPIARHPSDRKKMAVCAGGREAITHYSPLVCYEKGYTLAECVLETGRTHQIRVHMASIGHSVVGDKTYGIKSEKFNLSGQLLHAASLGFTHPKTGEYMRFSVPVSDYFEKVLKGLKPMENAF